MKQMKWQWRCPIRRLWLLKSLFLLSVTVTSDEVSNWTTTVADNSDPETETAFAFIETISSTTETVPLPTTRFSPFTVATATAATTTTTTTTTSVPFVFRSDEPVAPKFEFKFTRTLYNATIPENSAWKTNVVPDEKMGIYLNGNVEKVRYKITAGDRDKFFKAEELLVGDFCFLVIRTRTNINDVLNRERKARYVVEVKATATSGKKALEANTTVVINILDVNDLKPFFFQSEYEAVVPEDTPLHKSIIEVLAEDADLGKNGEVYYSFAEPSEQFSIHPTTGVVSLTRPLRYHEKSLHDLTVVGQDRGFSLRGSSSRQSTAKLTLRVKEVNLFVPEIYVQILTDVEENANFRVAAFVRVTDSDAGVHGEIRSLDIVEGDPDGLFRIKKIDEGEYSIELLPSINRESHSRTYNLTLRAIDNGVPPKQSFKSFLLKIAGVNDNIPVFDREIYEVNIPETSPVNTPIIRLKVTDPDESKTAKVFLEIVGGNEEGEFFLNTETGMLYTAAPLDAEERAFYTLTVSAIDQGSTRGRKQSSAKVKINVIDMNDNDPMFEMAETSVVLNENEPAGTTVFKVAAKDRDFGENSYISYSIANLNPVPFEIDHFSGVIRTTQVLDYESMRRNYILRIRASDWGLPFRRQAEMQVKIRLKDINDNRPQFEKVDCSGHVPRYVGIGTEILTLSAIDFDASNIISYRLVSGNEDNCFSLDSTSGVLSVTCDLMDVQVGDRTLNVTATDGTHFADVNRVHLHLVTAKRNLPGHGRLITDDSGAFECRDTGVARRLTEVLAAAERNNMPNQNQEEFAMMPSRYGENIHSPEFVNFPLEIRVNESAALGTRLGVIQARDRDLGYNGKLVFGISSGDQDSVFRVDPETGELKVIGYLDRERVDEYLLNVSVYDLGKPQKSSSKILPVTILDVNDNAPVFEKAVASFRIPEDEGNGTVIFRVSATDKDLGDNGMVSYSLVTDTSDFCVDSVQGILYVCSGLDREKQGLYELKIRATDGGGKDTGKPPLHSDANVRVHVDDVNDNPPRFALSTYNVRVREDIPVGTVVVIVSASDPDTKEGGDVRYSLSPESDLEGVFTVDKMYGTIRTAKELDFEQRQVYNLVVKARDRGTPPLHSETNVIVEIIDVNENMHPPVFGDFVVSCTVKENLPVGSYVIAVAATDQDPPGDDSRISYSIRGGDGIGYFTIDNEGRIKTTAVFDTESKPHYWLTVYAQDHGVVPLSSHLEVFVAIENENDNCPLTDEPIYYASVLENSGPGKVVIELGASDADADPNKSISYRISAGNPQSYFSIDPDSGTIRTTERKLDRENQAEHSLEITITDNGNPPLSSTTKVIISVDDVNDHAPEFEQSYYKITVSADGGPKQELFQNLSDNSPDAIFDLESWETSQVQSLGNNPILRVLAYDKDSGPNAVIEYSIKSGKAKGKFKIHPQTGVVYAQKEVLPGQDYELMILAADNGVPQKNSTTRVTVSVIPTKADSLHPPVFLNPDQQVQVTESDEVGFLVALIQATDADGDKIWYNIVDGDDRNEFFIGRETGNILLAKTLDWETQHHYNMTISATDGVHAAFTQLFVMVIDTNDHRPRFSKSLYEVDISENAEPGTEILELLAFDDDEDDKVFYSLHASRSPSSHDTFKVDSLSGAVILAAPLDRETIEEHLLTVMVKDQGTPSKRNYARIIVRVHDHNDHSPEFVRPIIQGKVYETAEIGTTVAKVLAIDRDRDDNAKITYSIISGNVGNVFSINPELGDLQLARPLDLFSLSEYMLNVKASDRGSPPLSSIIPVHIMITMADNASPRFLKNELAAEIYENKPVGTYVTHVQARSTSSVLYDIVEGNSDDMFLINPSVGVILTKGVLDYETKKFYNLTVEAVNMASARARCKVIVHVLDRNDNPPRFLQALYHGSISEASPIGSLVLTNENTPLVIKAEDADSELNALLSYDIVEIIPRRFFHIDSSTGAIRTVMTLDYEATPTFGFHVKVSDLGRPRLSSETTAKVQISIKDVNDCPPSFEHQEYNTTLLLPTYRGVALLRVNATDRDSPERTNLRYDIIEGNEGDPFIIDSKTGLVTVQDPNSMRKAYRLQVRVSDGKFSSVCYVNVKVESSENSGLVFEKPMYYGSIVENSTKVTTITVVNVLGSALNEHIIFSILNPTDMFVVGRTSGAIQTTGKKFDREVKDQYELVIEGRSNDLLKPRIAHVIVNVTVLDINDNCPMFVNLPYYAVVTVTAAKGDLVTNVHAVDLDKNENGEVRYELVKGHGELFKVSRKTGEITLRQNLEGHNIDFELIIAAYDGGINPCSTEVPVYIKVIDKSMPAFDKQFYTVSVPENIELLSPLSVSIQAVSSLNRKLIYSIVKGNDFEEFALNFNTAPDSSNGPCVIRVVDELDYETKKKYELTVRATDGVTGVFAEVLVNVLVEDINDCPPEFSQDLYNVSVSEATPFGTSVFRVFVRDNDTGINQKVRFDIEPDSTNSSEYFHVDPDEGTIFLKRALDHELHSSHRFTVIATDMGVPSLSSTAHVWVTVIDMNDNPPTFEQPSYSCVLSEHAARGQFITVISASDPDFVDQDKLYYAIVGGNEHQIFSIDHSTGVLTLVNLQNFRETQYLLNVSVSDGVYTSFSRVRIAILPANLHNPTFPQPQVEAMVKENQPAGTHVTQVSATDEDFGVYGELTYHIASELMKEYFDIDNVTGVVTTTTELDRESRRVFEVPIAAFDQGNRLGFLNLRVKVGDDNDNAPVFQLFEYRATIPGNLTVESGFLKVRATDSDEGENAELEYSISDGPSSTAKEVFGINSQTGGIYLLKSAEPYESQLFQFFVKAEDRGVPPRHSHVPVEIYIMGSHETAPMFERKDDKFFYSEKSPPGTVITKLKLVTNVTAKFRIVSGATDNPQFYIDSQGQLSLAQPLDRETTDFHLIGVLAESESNPLLTALTEVSLKVLDENDNPPKFESTPYRITIAENIEEGSSILRVVAHDDDQGNNKEVRYSLAQDNGDQANIFAIDSYTGWIRTLVPLDKEKISEYSFQVVAADNGVQKHFARTTVHVKLKDYNDNPPEFTSDHYTGSVNEDALPGTVVIQLQTTDADADLKSSVDLYITSGDVMSQFQIRQTGEIYIAKPLDRELVANYVLQVTATDGKFVTSTKVSISVIDANDNPPYCLKYRYRHILSEGVHPGTYIGSIEAVDIDGESTSNLRFYLTGDGADKFALDKSMGHLKTAAPLDREDQSKFLLVAHVQDWDKPKWECSSEVEILVSDLNDNPPQFEKETYSATLAEDVQVGTLVTKLHATDRDIGINRKIKYSFVDSANNHFKIEPDSGIITLLKPLDREEKPTYNLTVKASDQGTPQLFQTARLLVLVLDINDNPPEFTYKFYFAIVPEIESVGTEVVRVLATSKDTGVNAEIFYSIVGGNEHKKFDIHPKTGIITIVEPLDYERAKDYLLTVQATDGGVPPLSNHATVNITVVDSNDNAPVFLQMSYSATIREDAHIGDKILQVTANDLDSGLNGQVSYGIVKGDRQNQFTIDSDNGYLIVNSPLDREMTSSYVLEVQATDHGSPQLSNIVLVNLEISDFNDNPPLFGQENYTAVVQEDKPPGHTILKFHVTDADTGPNTSPFTFDFRAGNEALMFKLAQDGSLQSAKKFNHRVKDNYLLHVRVFDNGTPPMFSDTFVAVKVIEESQYPPVLTPLEIFVNSYMNEFPGGILGKIHATDQDTYDTLTYFLTPSTPGSLQSRMLDYIEINPQNGTLSAISVLDAGVYQLNVSVSDGKFTTTANAKISVESITEEMLENAVVIRFRDVSPQNFILSHKREFLRAIRLTLGVRPRDVIIISVQAVQGRKRATRNHVADKKQKAAKRKMFKFDNRTLLKSQERKEATGKNRKARQLHGGDLLDVLFAVRKSQSLGAFHSPDSIRIAMTRHLDEIEQSMRLIVEEIVRDRCSANYCIYGTCRDLYLLEPSQSAVIATDVTSFVSPKHQHKIKCNCNDGYAGERCENIVNECARNLCPANKICTPDASAQGYTCQCPDGFTGKLCELDVSQCHDENCYIPRNPISFSGMSYAQYRIDKGKIKRALEYEMSLLLRVRTVQQTGSLMYAAGKVDFNVLEIVNGVVQYRFDLGSGEGLVRVSTVFVSDGQWHEIRLERDGNNARVTVDGKYVAQGSAPGSNDALNVGDVIYLGAEIHLHPSVIALEDIERGFIGCMDDMRLAKDLLPLHMSWSSSVAVLKRFYNVEFNCDASVVLVPLGVCGSQPCQNGGTCEDLGDDTYECKCYPRFHGTNCEIDSNPCLSSPCLYGGKCTATADNDYVCDCMPRLSGKRCQHGRHCSPNPCRNGGVCEEGDNGPLCKCRGFTGDTCTTDIDECIAGPCLNSATCINTIGSYSCACQHSYTGKLCANSIYSSPITSSIYNLTLEELIGIISVFVIILLLVFCFILYKKIRSKRTRQHGNHINNDTRKDVVLNSTCKPNDTEFKRGSKLSNLEISQREPLQCPPRPASYTPSSTDAPGHLATIQTPLNNLDTLRSYGSAGDELECELPPDYVRNLNRSAPANNHPALDADSLCKPSWNGVIPLASFSENSIKNDLKLGNSKIIDPPKIPNPRSNTGRTNIGHTEDDQRYHWDCSDWARHDQRPLPNITEVPGSEVPDSSSFHSNESNDSNTHHVLPPVLGPVDPARDIDTLNEDQESEYVGDSECGTELNYSDDPRLNALDSGTEEYRFRDAENFLRHPNTYLPRYNIHSETEQNDESDDEYIGYGFPKHERSALLGSHGNLSSNVCDIDDLELEIPELKKLNSKEWKSGSVTQTAV